MLSRLLREWIKFDSGIEERSTQGWSFHCCNLYSILFRIPIIAFIMCHSSPVTMIGSLICAFACGVLYGLMSLGRKADREAMMVRLHLFFSVNFPIDI